MVKSFQGEAIKKADQNEMPSIQVSDYMATKLVTFREEQTIMEVIQLLLKHKISGGCVVNEQNELLGVISEGDTLKEVVKGKYDNMPTKAGLVSEYMTRNPIHIHPEMDIFEAAEMFLSKRIRRFPVVRDGKLVGQISQRDVIKAVDNAKSSNWKR